MADHLDLLNYTMIEPPFSDTTALDSTYMILLGLCDYTEHLLPGPK